MSTALAIPSAKTIVPKPTKNEIISAMVEIAREKFVAQQEAAAAALEACEAKIRKRYLKDFKAALKNLEIGPICFSHYGKPELYVGYVHLPENEESLVLQAELTKARNATRACFDEVGTKARLRAQFLNVGAHGDRVRLLLNDAASKAYLTELMTVPADGGGK